MTGGRSNPVTATQIRARDLALLLLAGVLGLSWLVFIYTHGVAFSPDSCKYMTSALHIRYAFEPAFYSQWPPLYSSLLAGCLLLVDFPGEAASLLSGLCMVGFLLVFALICRRYIGSSVLSCLFLLALFTFPGFLLVYCYAWSEVPFSLLLLLTCYFVFRHQDSGLFRDYVLAAICASLAGLTRYIGYAMIVTFLGYTACFLWARRRKAGVPATRYLLWCGVCILPGALYLFRNLWASGTLMGRRVAAEGNVFSNIVAAL